MNYTNDEIQHILEDLFEEKKKAKKLLQDLNDAARERTLLEEKIDQFKYPKLYPQPTQEDVVEKEDRENLLKQIDKLKEQTLKYKNLHENSQFQLSTIQKGLKDSKTYLQEKEEELSFLESQHERIKTQLQEAEKKEKATELKFREEQKKGEVALKTLKNLSEENLNLKTEHVELRGKYEELQDKQRSQQSKIDESTLSYQEKERHISKLQLDLQERHKVGVEKQELEKALEMELTKASKLLEEKKQLSYQLSELRLHADHLEKGMNYLRGRADETKFECTQLGEELSASQELTIKLTNDLKQAYREIEALRQTVKTYEENFKNTHEELEASQINLQDSSSQLGVLHHELKALQAQLKYVKEFTAIQETEIGNLSNLVTDLNFQLDYEKKKSVSLKEAFEMEEKTQQELRNNLLVLNGELEEIRNIKAVLEKENGLLVYTEKRNLELEKNLQDFHAVVADREKQFVELRRENIQLNENIKKLQQQNDDNFAQLQIAQQHLAKKVRENSQLSEWIEERSNQNNDLQDQNSDLQAKLADSRREFESVSQQQRMLQDQLKESIENGEISNRRWEEKYFAVYDKWVEAEAALKELRKYEEKYHQAQALLTNLGDVLGKPRDSASSQHQKEEEQEKSSHTNINYKHNLFE